jgi:lipoprotein-anchoring transpeptidase ErfK/SrfK
VTRTPELERLLERGHAAARAGKNAEARYFFESALKLAPGQPDALLWLAYFAGGGHASLVYLARLLQADPANWRARAAVGWARERARPQAAVALPARPSNPSRALVGLLALLLVSLMSVAFTRGALNLPLPTVTQARLIASPTFLPANTPLPAPSDTPLPAPSATPPELSSPTVPLSPTSRLPLLTPTSAAGGRRVYQTVTPAPALRAEPTRLSSSQAQDKVLTQTVAPPPSLPTALPTMSIGDSFRWIDVDLSEQRLIAYQGNEPARSVLVSTGLPRTPTVTGRFQVYVKYKAVRMSGPGYNLPNVPHTMYFYRDYALHGAYWHTNFGRPMSHGCVNLPLADAEWLYDWASVGTLVVVHE